MGEGERERDKLVSYTYLDGLARLFISKFAQEFS